MKKEIAMEWADALESGKYKQGCSYLCRDNKFCCLGVLAELATEKNICKKQQKTILFIMMVMVYYYQQVLIYGQEYMYLLQEY